MKGSAYIWGFLIPAIILLLIGFYLAGQGGGAIKMSAGLQIDAKIRNKMIKKRGLQIGLFFKLLVLFSIVVLFGALASIWNVQELWSIYSMSHSVQVNLIKLIK